VIRDRDGTPEIRHRKGQQSLREDEKHSDGQR
jgi:hypothetical protein